MSNGAARRSSSGIDEDLDLDFVAEPAQLNTAGYGKAKGSANADGAAVIQQPLHRAIMEHRPSLSANVSPTPIPPVHSPNALSRAFASTMGRLGRWKRALNSSSRHAGNPGSTEVSAFDMELNSEGDVRSGTVQYPNLANPTPQALPPVLPLILSSLDPLPSLDLLHPIPPTPPPAFTAGTAGSPEPDTDPPSAPTSSDSLAAREEAVEAPPNAALTSRIPPVEVSFRGKFSSRTSTSSTSSSSSYGVPVPPQSAFYTDRSALDRSWQLDVVSIDDLDLSDTSSDTSERRVAQAGPKKPPRRLPLRRAFEFVNRNRESVSSMGFASQDGSGPSASNSRRSSAVSGSAAEGGLGNTIQQWQVNALIDSLSDEEEDEGDVEDALRRLEGQMNHQKQRAKETKVDNWVKTIRERLAAGDYGDEAPRYLSDGEEEPSDAGHVGPRGSTLSSALSSPSRPGSPASVRHVSSFGVLAVDKDNTTPVPSQTPQPGSVSSAASRSAEDKKPAVEDAVPVEILRGRLMAPNPTSMVVAKIHSTPARLPTSIGLTDYHRSWVLNVPTVSLAIHFSMIDRELFLAIKFEELVSDDWRGPEAAMVANVLDWGQFLKDRARWKAQGVEGYHTSALVAARARFNLVTNFVISEIVDTPPAHRPPLVSKFIRVAWVRYISFLLANKRLTGRVFCFVLQKCFQLNNFSSMVAIVAGLRSDWVSRAMKRGWEPVHLPNLRILRDLTSFMDRSDDFKHIRRAVAQLTDPKLAAGASEEASSVRSSTRGKLTDGKPPTGVPFLGVSPLQSNIFFRF